jgi:hypothetical protein
MEVAYPILGRPGFVWPVYQLSNVDGASSVVFDTDIMVEVSCDTVPCRVARVVAGQPALGSLHLKGHVLRPQRGEQAPLIVFEPFPTRVGYSLSQRLTRSTVTRVVRVKYRARANGELQFDDLDYVGDLPRQPFVWK